MKCWADEPWLRSFMIGTLDLYIAISVLDSFLSSGPCICPPQQPAAGMFERTGQHAHAGAEQLGLDRFLGA